MWCRVLKADPFILNGQSVAFAPGKLVNVEMRAELDRLTSQGSVGPAELSHRPSERPIRRSETAPKIAPGTVYGTWTGRSLPLSMRLPLPPQTRRLRIGVFITNTMHYSGGRIHLYQIGWAMAKMGEAEVFMVSELVPPWRGDYPILPDYHYVNLAAGAGKDLPPDLDVLIADRGRKLQIALDYKAKYPNCIVLAFNFETANWCEAVCPDLGAILRKESDSVVRDYSRVDHLLVNSQESGKWLKKYMEEETKKPFSTPISVLPAAVNTFALEKALALGRPSSAPRNPYALWVSRSVPHKCLPDVVDAIWALDNPFDLVVIGNACPKPPSSVRHRVHFCKGIGDVEKFQLMLHAHTILCPSLFEGYGIVPGEALASGVKPVVFDLPVLREVYGERLDYVKHGDFSALTERIRVVATSPKQEADAADARSRYGMEMEVERVKKTPCFRTGKPSISAQFIVYWGFCPEAVEAIYDQADQIIIAYGPVEIVRKRGVAPDGSLELIRSLPDPDHKIEVYERPVWKDKTEMHNFCCRKVRGNRMLVLGGDEVMVGLQEWRDDSAIYSACPRFVHFYSDAQHYLTEGGVWGKQVAPFGSFTPHCRYTYWRPSYRFRCQSQITDAGGYDVNKADACQACDRHPGTIIYHVGNLLPASTLQAKADFYLDRDRCPNERRMKGSVLPVSWELPPVVTKALDRLGVSQ